MNASGHTRFGHRYIESDEDVLRSPSENEYPDPESLSTYPWWRDTIAAGDVAINSEPEQPHTLHRSSSEQDQTNNYDAKTTSDVSDKGFSEKLSPEVTKRSLEVTTRGRPRGRRKRTFHERNHGETARRSLRGIKRGQRRPIEPSDEFKSLHTQAVEAFVDADFETAEHLTLQAILVNPEMYAAHSLLAEIHTAKGDHDKSLTALFNGAHTRPRDTKGWTELAEKFLKRAQGGDGLALTDALYCYSRVVQIEPQNIDARHQRAELNRRLGYNGRAAAEYGSLLKTCPHNMVILRSLAEIYTELGDSRRAMKHYNASISFYQCQEPERAESFTWSDVNIYVELYADQQRYEEGIRVLKFLSRWLLGRAGDPVWEAFDQDDREFDIGDHPRRVQVPGFQEGAYGDMSYGKGMPIELHVKLGIYRLRSVKQQVEEATKHFELLEPDDTSQEATLYNYPDLFRDVASALRDTGYHREALRYWQPLKQVSEFVTATDYAGMAFCYKSLGLGSEAEACYRHIVEMEQDPSSTQPHLPLSTTLTAVAGQTTSDTMGGMFQQPQANEAVASETSTFEGTPHNPTPSAMLMPRSSKQSAKHRESERRFQAQLHEERLQSLYGRTQELLERARHGDAEALVPWMAATQELVDDFRSHRGFYPCDRSLKAYERSKSSATESLKTRVNQAMQDIIGQLERSETDDFGNDPALSAGDFRGIPFASWLDLILEYAVLLARSCDIHKAYEVVNVAKNANIFYSSVESMFLIHTCWFTCALMANDEETSCNVARWFMKDFQFVTDGYRLFSAVNRLCDGRNTWFNCGPSQKYVRRQLKAMDYSLVGQGQNRCVNQERASYSTKDSEGKPIYATDMDLALLVLYGQVLYMGRSFAVALNYFLRAFALEPKNPLVNLSLALAYIQYAIKRQAANRHHLITQGLTFLFAYYDLRRRSGDASEQQEAEFNVARAYHMLGLTHLAIPYYERCLSCSNGLQEVRSSPRDDFAAEAAFALRNIWAANGEMGKAADISRMYLVV